jgi:formylglycine-generating enzyme required for sulfatase activity
MIVGPWRLMVAGAAFLAFCGTVTAEEKRVALVIGNGAYQNAPQLKNPPNDANAVAAALRELHFEVITGIDLDQKGMIAKLRSFRERVQGAAIALVFYSGHGIQVNGENWLLPVSAKLDSDQDLQYEALKVDTVIGEAEGAQQMRLIILDACRDNPFKEKLTRSILSSHRTVSVSRGFARIDPKSSGTLIAYATRADDVASDGNGRNSPFTEAFLEHLRTPSIDVRLLFGKVHDTVMKSTGGRQEPTIYGSLGGDPVYLSVIIPSGQQATVTVGAPSPPHVDAAAIEFSAWTITQKIDSVEAYEKFRDQYPNSQYVPFAEMRIKSLREVSNENKATQSAEQHPKIALQKSGDGLGTAPMPERTDHITGNTVDGRQTYSGPVLVSLTIKNMQLSMSRAHITRREWDKCVQANACKGDEKELFNDALPVTGISWIAVNDYVKWLSAVTGRRFRLPKSDELIFALKGDLNQAAPKDASLRLRNFVTVEFADAAPMDQLVGARGNVSDWIGDCKRGGKSDECVIAGVMGSSWREPFVNLSDIRWYPVDAAGDAIGFRVVAEPE